ncbi:2-nitropropane dioxygenase [Hysterangium stoloniferum]|nr:2-nitropropane dioxygenase [Hysterangium stoloniferum]
MAGASGGALAAQVTLGGGFGFIASGYGDSASFSRELDKASILLSTSPAASLNIGAGYLGWLLDKGGDTVQNLRNALERKVKCIWLSFGPELGKWVDYIRKYDEERQVPHKTLVWILVSSVAEAEQAVNGWKADVLVVQGIEAGGHGHSQALPLMTLLPLITQSIPHSPPLVAAGGLSTGSQVAAMLVLGASGAAMGTRFLATPESTYSNGQKSAVISGKVSVRTTVFDDVRGTTGWPAGIDGRAIPNKTLDDEQNGLGIEERRRLFDESVRNDDPSRAVVWSGSSVSLVNELVDAASLSRTIQGEIIARISAVKGIVD